MEQIVSEEPGDAWVHMLLFEMGQPALESAPDGTLMDPGPEVRIRYRNWSLSGAESTALIAALSASFKAVAPNMWVITAGAGT